MVCITMRSELGKAAVTTCLNYGATGFWLHDDYLGRMSIIDCTYQLNVRN